jgi:hypothetical protein
LRETPLIVIFFFFNSSFEKVITVVFNILMWDKHASPLGTAFLLLCLAGGAMYEQAPMRSVPEAASVMSNELHSEILSSTAATIEVCNTKSSRDTSTSVDARDEGKALGIFFDVSSSNSEMRTNAGYGSFLSRAQPSSQTNSAETRSRSDS